MSVARQIDMLWGDGVTDEHNLEALEALAQFFEYCETNSLLTRVATQNGDGGSNGADFGFGDTGNNAWIYVEFDQGAHLMGVLAQATNGGNFGASPGDPGDADGGSLLAIAMAVREDGLSPWNGTTDNDGADSKGDPVWTDGGVTTVHCFPMSNNPAPSFTTLNDYAHATSRENCGRVGGIAANNGYHRAHFFANEDGLFMKIDAFNNGVYTIDVAVGRYAPVGHMVATCTLPYFMACSGSGDTGVFGLGPVATPPPFQEYGDPDGVPSEGHGGVLARLADGVIRFQMFILSTGSHSSAYQPNTIYPTPRYEVAPFSLLAWESYPVHRYGLLGTCPIELYGYGDEMVVNEINAAGTICAFGHTTTSTAKTVVSWDGGAAVSPAGNTTGTQLGRQSFTA